MLTVAKVAASGAAAFGAYLEGRTQAPEAGDYYLSEGGERTEAPGRWALGEQGAAVLGVDASRPVGGEDFRAVMQVRNPATGGQLRAVGGGGNAVAAIDATFSAPKSVSAVWALASPELRARIEAAQERAVDAALAHACEWVPMVRRRLDRSVVVRETPLEILASSWRHTTARAVAGRAPDPQLHSHVVLHGAVRRGDGRVVAIESRAWLVHQRELGAAYRAQLASGLERLGFQIEAGTGRGGRYFEIHGVPGGLIEEWSGRHRQVREAIDQRFSERVEQLRGQVQAGGPGAAAAAQRLAAVESSGQLLPGEQRAIAMATRSGKSDLLLTAGDLDQAWWQTAVEHDFDARSVQALGGQERGRGVELLVGEGEQQPEQRLGQRILSRLTEFDATFAPREARAVALEAAVGEDSRRALGVLQELRERGEILELVDGRQTTRAHRGTERAAVTAAQALADSPGEAVAERLVDVEVDRLQDELSEPGATLAAEQQQAVRAACSDRRLVVVVGQAGTGKSTALTGVARAHQAAGRQLIVTSTGAQAADRLAAELSAAGVTVQRYSTMALRAAVARGAVKLGPGVTVIHDEAALASTREQAWLLDAAVGSGASVIEVGDPYQSKAVGAGGLWPEIEQAAAARDGLVELSRIVRARDAADRRDQARWRADEHQQALAGYAARGRVMIAGSQQQAEDQALEAAYTDRQDGKTALVVAQTSNDHLDGLNARAQALRIQDNELGGREVALEGRPYGLRAGDQIVVRSASRHPDLGAVRNGTRGVVVDVADEQHATLRLSDGRQAIWEQRQLDAASARLAYVSHTFPAQGQTVDRAHVIADRLADANGTYVALTRAREQTRIYASAERLDALEEPGNVGERDGRGPVDRLGRLASLLGRSEPEVPSIATPLAHEQTIERERELERASSRSTRRPSTDNDNDVDVDGSRRRSSQREQQRARLDRARVDRDQAAAQLQQARAERDQAAQVVATRPDDPELVRVLTDAGYAAEQAEQAAGDSERLTAQLAGLGRLARLGERGRGLRAQRGVARDREHHATDRQQRLERQAAVREERLVEHQQAWTVEHPGALQRHQEAERAYTQALDRYQAAEQTYQTLQTRGLVADSFPTPVQAGRRRWPRPEDKDTLTRDRDRDRGRDGPSFER